MPYVASIDTYLPCWVAQVDGARIGLAHNIGSPTAMSALAILEGSANGAG